MNSVFVRAFGIIPFQMRRLDSSPKVELWYLLLRNLNGGHWGFPKGRPDEDDETPIQIALREFGEETGLEVKTSVRIVQDDKPIEERYKFPRSLMFGEEGKAIANGSYGKQEEVEVDKITTYFMGRLLFDTSMPLSVQEEEIIDHGYFEYEKALDILTYEEQRNSLRTAHTRLMEHMTANPDAFVLPLPING